MSSHNINQKKLNQHQSINSQCQKDHAIAWFKNKKKLILMDVCTLLYNILHISCEKHIAR